MPKLSIVVPVYNIEKYISDCVESILRQTYSDFELILVDDGSKDKSGIICDEYEKKDKRIKVIHKRNAGAAAARKSGVQVAKGEYIGFVDGDDWIEINMYELLMKKIEEGYKLASCNFYYDYGKHKVEHNDKLIYSENKGNKIIDIVNIEKYFEFLIIPNLWTKVFSRELLMEIQNNVDDKISIGDDAMILFPYIARVHEVGMIDYPLYHYRQNISSMTHSYDEDITDKINRAIIQLDKSEEVIENYNEQIKLYKYFLSILVLKNEGLKTKKLNEIKSNVIKLMNTDWLWEILSTTKLPKADLFSVMLNVSLRRKRWWFVAFLLVIWRKHYMKSR